MSTADKDARDAARTRQAAHKPTDRQKARSPRLPGSKRGGGGGGARPALNLGADTDDRADDASSSGAETATDEDAAPRREREVPLEPMVSDAAARARLLRKGTSTPMHVRAGLTRR